MNVLTSPRPLARFAAVGAAAVAVVYALIGFKVVTVGGVTDVEAGPVVPLVLAGIAFALLALALALRPARRVLIAGAVLTLAVTIGYVAISPDRAPSYEAWGLSLHAVEVVILGVLIAALVGVMARDRRRDPVR